MLLLKHTKKRTQPHVVLYPRFYSINKTYNKDIVIEAHKFQHVSAPIASQCNSCTYQALPICEGTADVGQVLYVIRWGLHVTARDGYWCLTNEGHKINRFLPKGSMIAL